MKNRSGCVKSGVTIAILMSAFTLVAICAAAFLYYFPRQQERIRAQYAPPVVLVNAPDPGAAATVGSYLMVSATAMGGRPIVSVELWLDGVLTGTQTSEDDEGDEPFYADFDLLVPSEGPHMLFVRAVDSIGLMGQSPPLTLTGLPKPAEVFRMVEWQQGETLSVIAAENDTQPEVLQELNPGLGDTSPAGTTIMVPAPPEAGSGPIQQPPVPAGNAAVQIPGVPMMQTASDKSPGIQPSGTFLPEPFAGKVGPPAAPSGLQAEVKGCKITLRWDDNAEDEEEYYVYLVPVTFQGFETPFAYLKASASTGPAWYELETPTGGAFSIWVEAANSYGSVPSNMVWIQVPETCPSLWASQLQFSLLDLSVAGGYDRVYCYVSVEGSPESRLPVEQNVFFLIQDGKAKNYVGPGPVQGTSMGALLNASFPVPADGSVDSSGQCWGWSGSALNKLGTFDSKLTSETWTGDSQTIDGGGGSFQFGVTISGVSNTGFESTDPTLPVPYDVVEEPPPAGTTTSYYPPARLLRWKWDGDPQKADGFEIFLNGKLYGPAPVTARELIVQLPGECDQSVRWQVAAKTGSTISNLSAPVQYQLPPCQVYLRVRFDSINLIWSDDGIPNKGFPCEDLDAHFVLAVREVVRSFWGGTSFMPMKCGIYPFSNLTSGPYQQLYGPEPDVITIPVSPGEDLGQIWIQTRFCDHDDSSWEDLFATFTDHPWGAFYPLGEQKWSSEGEWPCSSTLSKTGITDEAKATITITFSVYPNTCRDTPPPTGF